MRPVCWYQPMCRVRVRIKPVFQAINAQSQAPGWNLNKYVTGASGKVIEHFGSGNKPDSRTLEETIEKVVQQLNCSALARLPARHSIAPHRK